MAACQKQVGEYAESEKRKCLGHSDSKIAGSSKRREGSCYQMRKRRVVVNARFEGGPNSLWRPQMDDGSGDDLVVPQLAGVKGDKSKEKDDAERSQNQPGSTFKELVDFATSIEHVSIRQGSVTLSAT
jgi:hypothetical protein